MASISNDGNGLRRIQFVIDGNRRAIRLGHCTAKQAMTVCTHIEAILSAKLANSAVETATAQWLGEIDDTLHGRLAAAGLVVSRERNATTLGKFLADYFSSLVVKDGTEIAYGQTRDMLNRILGEGRTLRSIGPEDADKWRQVLVAEGYAGATISRRVGVARMMFGKAVKWKLVGENPFTDVKAGSQTNKARQFFVSREAADKLIEACPDAQWRLMVALSRYGGIRTPSETLLLRWGDIDWDSGRIHVTSPKTEHHSGGGSRIIPIFPELKKPLAECFEAALPGEEYCITRYRSAACNLRTQLERIIKRAGLTPWPKLWHNMRASRQTELAETYPIQVVCSWIGNSIDVAQGHYLQVTDAHFERAVSTIQPSPASPETASKQAAHNAAQYGAETASKAPQGDNTDDKETRNLLGLAEVCNDVHKYVMGAAGFEPA